MRAEVSKERPTAVLCVQLGARYVQIRQTAKIRRALADIILLRFDVRAFAHTYVRAYTCCARYRYTGIYPRDRE